MKTQKKKRMRTIKRTIWIVALIGVSIIVYAFMTSNESVETPGEIKTQKVHKQDISASVSATGIIKPQIGAEVRIGTRASGIVTNLYVNIGDYVKKGQLLAKIDASELNAKHQQAKANLKYAKTTLKYAKLEFERIKKLNAKQYVSQQVFEEAEKNVEVAKAIVLQEKSNVDYANIQLDYTKIFASTEGVIGSVSTQKGETVASAFTSPTFVTIIDLDRLEVWAYIDETDIGRIEVGQKASFTVDTYPETEFSGTVMAIYPKAEIQNNVVNYITIIKIEKQIDKILRPEMTTSINVYMEKHENAVTVTSKALIRKSGKYYVKKLQNNKVIEVEVKTGLRQNGYVEILNGLSEGDQVIIDK